MHLNRFIFQIKLTAVFLTIYASVHAQNNFWGKNETEIIFNHLTYEHGLSSNVTNCILKDSQGFIWIGTDAGLNRFDGFDVKIYKHKSEDINTISNSVIRTLFEDSKGNIWIGTDRGLNIYNPNTQTFRHFLSEADKPGSISNNTISSITEDKNGDIWIGTFFGLNKLTEWKNGIPIFKRYYTLKNKTNSFNNNRIFCLYTDSKDNLWIGTEGGGLYLLAANNKRSEAIHFDHIYSRRNDGSELSESTVFCINELSESNLYIGTDHGFTILKKNNNKYNTKHYIANNETNWFTENRVYSIVKDIKGKIWIGTFGGGLLQFNEVENSFRKYTNNIYDNKSISRNHVYALYPDRNGFLWIVTRETGIDYINPDIQNFTNINYHPDNKNSISSNIVKSISEDSDGNFWFGTYGGGLNKYNPRKYKYESYKLNPLETESISSNIIETTCIDHLGRIWLGTPTGLNMFDPKKNTFKTYKHNSSKPNSIVDASIWYILPAKDKSGLWIATYNGLDKFDWASNTFLHFKNNAKLKTSLSYNNIRALLEDSKGNLWIGTWGGGLNKLNLNKTDQLDSAKFIHYRRNYSTTNGISSDLVNTLFEDSNGNLWIGTQEGLSKYNPTTDTFTNYDVSSGLADNIVKGILEDKYGELWISTQKGLSQLNPNTNKFHNFYYEDGIQGNIFNLSSCLVNSRGELMFGGNSGISIFNPDDVKLTSNPPKVYIEDLKVNNTRINPGDILKDRVLYSLNLNRTDKIKLDYNENVIGLKFSAIEFSHPEKILFSYMLEGVDKTWQTTTYQNRAITYANLEKGNYKFKVRVSNIYGDWSSATKTISFQIFPPWYKTVLAYLGYSLFIIGLVLFVGRLILIRIKIKRELDKEKSERKRQAELDQFKLQFFTNISHEIRTPLTLISGPLQKLIHRNSKMNKAQIDQQLFTINRSVSILTKLVNQILDFRKAENNSIQLQIRYSDICKQLRGHIDDFNDYATDKNLKLNWNSSFNSIHYWYDIDILEKVFYNLLSNAIKYTSAGGNISIYLKNPGEIELPRNTPHNKEDYFCFIVEDTGIGISDEDKKYIFERFYQINSANKNMPGTGIGLSLTKSLVEHHKGFITLESQLGKGTQFTVWLPATKSFFAPSEILTSNLADEQNVSNEVHSIITTLNDDTIPDEDALNTESKEYSILIVEDNADLRKFISDIFIQNYNVIVASNGQEGLINVEKHNPDLIITDIMMPIMSGIEMTKSIKKNINSSHIPVIMLTAKNTIDNEIEGLKTGADYYLSKPFNIKQLELVVNNTIESRIILQKKYSGFNIPKATDPNVLSLDEKFIIKVTQIIDDMISDPELSVETLASMVNITTVSLYRKIKALTGMSPNEFIRSYRLERASKLLVQKKFKVSEIAYEVGFNDPKYFGKCFKKTYGVSPSEYVKSNTKDTQN
ncbi:hybrid sensor histidine kinase/response regulator [Puteibacter caeruleilacunae]|nr:hybrid sensor histidine kinase/response regulator [Puteibacter caeruleilacunae]